VTGARISPRLASLAVVALLLAGAGCSSNQGAQPAPQSGSVQVTRSGEETFVSVEEAAAEPLNPVCVAYCDRLASCWHARPNNNELMMTRDEILKRCNAEQAACHTPTTDMLCCSEITDCYDFNRCIAQSRDHVMSCERFRPPK
jgi:hypothetical protein